MNKKAKAAAGNNGSINPFDYFADNQRFFDVNYAENSDVLQTNPAAHLQQNKKVIRLFRCFCCEKNRTAQKMSNCLAVCRECYWKAQSKGAIGIRNFFEKTLNNFHKFLRRRVEI